MKPDSSSSSYLAWFLGTLLALLLMSAGLSTYFEPLTGDLTRIGRWSEREYGPTRSQPAHPILANGQAGLSPQVLILGDSFSYRNIWQSQLAEIGKIEPLSFQFKDVGCIDNWLTWLAEKRYFDARTVIIQVAERSFVPVFGNKRTCPRSTPLPTAIQSKAKENSVDFPGMTLDAEYILRTAANTLRMRWQEGRVSSGDVVNVPLATAKLFSNRQANRLLYYAEDENKKAWTPKDIDFAVGNLKLIQDRLLRDELRLVVAVVPDKSTTYRPYLLSEAEKNGYPDIFAAIEAAGIESVDLLTGFRRKVGVSVDFYLPDDTHLGSSGYRVMATEIAERLKFLDKKMQPQ